MNSSAVASAVLAKVCTSSRPFLEFAQPGERQHLRAHFEISSRQLTTPSHRPRRSPAADPVVQAHLAIRSTKRAAPRSSSMPSCGETSISRNIGSMRRTSASRSSRARSCGLSLKYQAAHSQPRQVAWANVSPCPAQWSKCAASRRGSTCGTTAQKALAHSWETASRRWAQTCADQAS